MPDLSDYTVPTTDLQAVNVILECIGQLPVETLDNPGADAATAIHRLGEASIEVQEEGWSWNTDDCYVIDPAEDGTVTLPANCLKLRQAWTSDTYRKRLVQRGQRLYDRKGSTFTIGASVKCEMVVGLPFDQIPQAARWYVTMKAARRMASGKLVSGTAYQFTSADESQARIRMEQSEDDAQHMDTLADTNPHIAFMRYR